MGHCYSDIFTYPFIHLHLYMLYIRVSQPGFHRTLGFLELVSGVPQEKIGNGAVKLVY